MRLRQFQLEKGVLGFLRTLSAYLLMGVMLAIFAGGCAGSWGKGSLVQGSKPTPEGNSSETIKIVVDRDGLFGIHQQELRQDISDDMFTNPDRWKLVHQGQIVNFWITGEDNNRTLIFYGRPNPGTYTRENYYWLIPKDTPSTSSVSIAPTPMESPKNELASHGLGGDYLESIHIEENRSYLPQADGEEHWFWMPLVAPNSTELEAPLDSIAPGPARLRLSVWASSDAVQNPDHHLLIKINGNQVVDKVWDGKGVYLVEGEFTTEVLREGVNKISIEAPGDTGAVVEILHIDWLALDYSRLPQAMNSRLEFTSPGSPLVFDGFTGPIDFYDVTNPYQVVQVGNDLQASDAFSGDPGKRYLAVDPDGILLPKRIEAGIMSPNLRSAGEGADYLVIGPTDLIGAMQPLVEYRESQGYQVAVIPVNAIYDQFGYGSPIPQVIHEFVNYAVKFWQPAPRYLVLVGDASYDPQNYLGIPQANQMPTFLINTEFGGETSSDTGFAQLNDDPWPDIATGLIPARTPSQVTAYVEKVLRYEETLPPVTKPMSLVAIADGQDPSFKADAQGFLDLFPSVRFQAELYAPPAGATDAQQQISDLFNHDFSIIAYFGHGSIEMWGKDKLFTSQAVSQLSGLNHYPILFNFTCLTGLYTHPKVDSLAETFLWQPDGGAIAVLAPSSLTLPYDQGFLSNSLAKLIIDNPAATIGELHLNARRQTPVDNSGGLDVMRTFMLFGDPALRLSGE